MGDYVLEQVLLLLLAIAANLLSAMAGGGAGLVQLPMLIFLGLPFSTALATHKIATVALGIGASARHLQGGTLNWRFATFMLLCGLPGVVLGARTVLFFPEQWAKALLGLLTVGLGLYSFSQKALGQHHLPRHRDPAGLAFGGAVLFFIGFINGSLTSGTGLFVTLWLVGWFGLDYKRALAHTLVLVGLFWNGTGAATLVLLTHPQWSWLPALLLGSVLGGYWGTQIALARGNRLIKRVFELATIAVGAALLISVFSGGEG